MLFPFLLTLCFWMLCSFFLSLQKEGLLCFSMEKRKSLMKWLKNVRAGCRSYFLTYFTDSHLAMRGRYLITLVASSSLHPSLAKNTQEKKKERDRPREADPTDPR